MFEKIYDPHQIESKWQDWWENNGTNQTDIYEAKNSYYVLMMFPYPSAEGLHVGNVYAFVGADIQGRFRRMQGYDVFEPIGFDAFGIHSENFAMKIGRHPAELIPSNVQNFTRQLKMMAFMYDWRYCVDTTSPEYYKWTQWIFLQLYKKGLAYRDEKEVNFCPDCGTVIADEQVNPDGTCERHSETMVQRRRMPCWFFRITEFSDRLIDNHDWLDWSDKTKIAQVAWVGRSKGAEIDFSVVGSDAKVRVFTTRPDTLFGATFVVLAPDHPLVDIIASKNQKAEVEKYKEQAAAKTAEERTSADKDKTGVDTGARAINPLTGEEIPVFIADYVMMGYGTGAIMAVPSGDHRDFAFAKEYELPVIPIIDPDMNQYEADFLSGFDSPVTNKEDKKAAREAVLASNAAWSGPGKMINSQNDDLNINGLEKEEAVSKTIEWLESKGLGKESRQYRLRDWGISRQRYWGPPIPILYDEEGNAHPVPEDQLPVELPPLQDFRPKGDGRGPLANASDWVNVKIDGKKYRRETDVMDNFLDSAWYFLRYPSANDADKPWDPELIKKWLPVDIYVGGNEHAVLHLLYTRFICMALTEAGVLEMGETENMPDVAEPFKKFRAHGLLIKEGRKMSKKWGNVVNPDEFVEQHGADILRSYLMFLGPYQQGGDFRDKDIQGIRRFFNRVHAYYFGDDAPAVTDEVNLPKELLVKAHQTVKKVTDDIEGLSYNTALAALMELLNTLKGSDKTSTFIREAVCRLLAPFAPHLSEEIWHDALNHSESVFEGGWPEFDEKLTVLDEIEIPIQINGKIREKIIVSRTAPKDELEAAALGTNAVKKQLGDGAQVRKTIVVPGRLVNIIIK